MIITLLIQSSGLEKVPGAVKAMAWSPDGYCLAVAWSTQGMALWSAFGSLLYCTLLDQVEVTRFLAPINFVSCLKRNYTGTAETLLYFFLMNPLNSKNLFILNT